MIFKLVTGILECSVSNYTLDYVELELKFDNKPTIYKTLTKDSFIDLESWVKENYHLI